MEVVMKQLGLAVILLAVFVMVLAPSSAKAQTACTAANWSGQTCTSSTPCTITCTTTTCNGTAGNDVICGTDATQTFNADAGHDCIRAGGGSDTVNAGSGNDCV